MMKRVDKSSLRLHSFAVPCEGKRQFENEHHAREAADFHMLENMNVELDVYQCTTCAYWHMTQVNKPVIKTKKRKK